MKFLEAHAALMGRYSEASLSTDRISNTPAAFWCFSSCPSDTCPDAHSRQSVRVQGQWLSPRVVNLALQYLTEAVKQASQLGRDLAAEAVDATDC